MDIGEIQIRSDFRVGVTDQHVPQKGEFCYLIPTLKKGERTPTKIDFFAENELTPNLAYKIQKP